MIAMLLGLFAKGNGVKTGAAIGGTSLLSLIFYLHNDVTSKIEAEIATKVQMRREIVKERNEHLELVLKPLHKDLVNQQREIEETKRLVRDIHNYLLEK